MAGFQIGQYVSGGAVEAPFVSQSVASAPDHRCRQVVAVVAVNLLLTTLAAVVTAPIVPQAQASAPQYRWQLSQTSAGTPKPLYGDASIPIQTQPWANPDRRRPVTDTSRGTPKPLYADAQLPVQNAPAPVLDRLRWLPADATRGIPKALYGDALAPFLNVPHTAPDRVRPVVDTSRSQPITLQAIVIPLPPFTLPHHAPVRYPHGLADTSGCTPKTLYDDVVPPVTPAADTGPTPAGSKKRGRPPKRFVVEWDGRIFHVEGEREALELLAELRAKTSERVAQQAKVLARRAVKRDSPPPLEAPRVTVSGDATIGAQRAAERAQAELAALYEREAERAYIAALEWHLARLRDEHEALTLLVLDDD